MASIREAFLLFVRAVKILWEGLWTFVQLNVVWLLLCLPIVTAPASFIALYYVADRAARDETINVRDFFVGFKQYFIKGTLLGLIDLVAVALLATNLLFYSQISAGWGQVARAIWIAVSLFWLLLQVYLLPMFVVQIEPSLKTTVRNSAMFVLLGPLFTVTVAITLVTLAALSAVLIVPFMIISMSAIAVYSCVVMNNRLQVLKARQAALAASAGPEDDSTPGNDN